MDISGTCGGASDVKPSLIGSDMAKDPIRRGRGQSARRAAAEAAGSWRELAVAARAKAAMAGE